MGATYGVVIVGAGNIAAAHAHAVQQLPNARLVGVASRTPDKAAAVAALYGVKGYGSVAEAVADPDVHVVAVLTPSGAHLEPALAAVRAGKHVVVEKPIEVSTARAEELVSAAEQAGVALGVIFMSRFADANVELKRAVDRGDLGHLLQGNAVVPWFRDQAYYDSGAWRGTRLLDGGGALMNQAIHQVDLLLWVMGPVTEVFAYAGTLAHERIEVEDTLVASVRFANGALGQISAATSLWPGRPKLLEVYGSKGHVVVEDDAVKAVAFKESSVGSALRGLQVASGATGGGTTVGTTGGASDPMAISFENHRRQYEEFFSALDAGRAPAVDGREGMKAVRLIEAVYQSVAEGRAVRVG